MAVCVADHRYLRLLQQLLLVLSVGSPGSAVGLFAVRELKILAEGNVERYQVIRALNPGVPCNPLIALALIVLVLVVVLVLDFCY